MNFLVVMADDHGAWASPVYGDPVIQAPAMEWIAQGGIRFDQAFTPCPVCSPARASFFTGRLPSQHGILDYIRERDHVDRDWMAGRRTLPVALREVGYRTGLVGKWHCGRSWMPQPGFDRWVSYAGDQFCHRGRQRYVVDGLEVESAGQQISFFRDESLRFLRESGEAGGSPFFLFVGPVNTHSPFRDQPRRWVERYAKEDFSHVPNEEPREQDSQVRFRAPQDPAKRIEMLAQYAAGVSAIDDLVGQLIDEVDALGMLDQTMIVYTSDHGHMNGQHGLYTKGNATIPQNFYEESIRIPMLIRMPGGRRTGAASFPVDLCDLGATLARLAGASLAEGDPSPVVGQDLSAWFEGRDIEAKSVQLAEYGNARMIRDGRWKLIRRYAPHDHAYGDELFDLLADPRERINLANAPSRALVRERLCAELETRFIQAGCVPRAHCPVLETVVHNPFEPWRHDEAWVKSLIQSGQRSYDRTV